MSSKRFSKEQMQLMVNRHGSDQKIADALGTTRQNIQQQRNNLDIDPYKKTVLRKRNADILRMRNNGWIISDIAHKFKLSERQIIRIIKRGNNENN